MSKNYQRGSLWSRWDLHVHTPASCVANDYGGADDTSWEKFITTLESLPEDIKVIGINDYLFLEGYEKVIEFKNAGRLQNLDLILPVIEFRLKEFVGSDQLNRINYHIIFSDELGADLIRTQFLNSLSGKAKMNPDLPDDVSWAGVLTPDTLTEFGQHIIDKTPKDKRDNTSPLETGFNNINFELSEIEKILGEKDTPNTYLKDKYFKAIGKAEWEDFRWGGGASEKKGLINGCHFVFTASPTADSANIGKGKLIEQGVNSRLLHCSDAHAYCGTDDYSVTLPKELGHCFTWIKADPSFEGLRQILYEPEERLKIQKFSPNLDYAKVWIEKIKFENSQNFVIPNAELLVNRGLVSIIGGRGGGKSSLLESLGMLNEKHGKKDINGKPKIIEYFRDNPGNLAPAPDYDLTVTLKNKDSGITEHSKNLHEDDDLELPILYIGQETISKTATNDEELTRYVYNAIGLSDKSLSLAEELGDLERTINAIDEEHQGIHRIKEEYGFEGFGKYVEFRTLLIEKIKTKDERAKTLSSKDTTQILTAINNEEETISKANKAKANLNSLSEDLLEDEKNELIESINDFNSDEKLSDKVITKVDFSRQVKEIGEISESLDKVIKTSEEKIKSEEENLRKLGIKESVPVLLAQSKSIRLEIQNIKDDQERFEASVKRLSDLKVKRLKEFGALTTEIEDQVERINDCFDEFKDSRNDESPDEKDLFLNIINGLEVVGEINFNKEGFLQFILDNCDKRSVDIKDIEKEIFGDGASPFEDYKNWVLTKLDKWLDENTSQFKGKHSGISEIVKSLLVYVHSEDIITVNSSVSLHGKAIETMSMGQKGTTLLKVLLSGSSAGIIIIDQPEDHLDNNFLANELVPLLRRVKASRQIILATHNANLVVNTDTDQIIIANVEEGDVPYYTGSIENPEVNEKAQNILEGGSEAFKLRRDRYFK
jgi:ABC-type Mn2+/Zn2+ transport system ATPase subunit